MITYTKEYWQAFNDLERTCNEIEMSLPFDSDVSTINSLAAYLRQSFKDWQAINGL